MAEAETAAPVILAADDDATIRRVIERSLRGEGYEVRLCESGEEALDALREAPFALLLLDVRMGGMSGFDAAEKLRAGQAGEVNRNVPIVFVTAEADGASYERSFDVGAHRYITKPFDPDALIAAVKALMHEGG
jgi:CheY-like chemotaxis protein